MKARSDYAMAQRQLRTDAGLSVRQLSEISGVSHSYLSQVENGTRDTPSRDVVMKLYEAFISLNYEGHHLLEVAGYKLDSPNAIEYPAREMRAFTKLAKTMNMTVEELTNQILKN